MAEMVPEEIISLREEGGIEYPQVNQRSEEAKEHRRWEMHHSKWGAPGNPWGGKGNDLYVKGQPGQPSKKLGPPGAAYPKMLFKARRGEHDAACEQRGCWCPQLHSGKLFVIAPGMNPECESWSKGSYVVVETEDQHLKMRGQGWSDTQEKAIELAEANDHALAQAAAERHYAEKRMSPKAQEEAKAVDQEEFHHVAEIKETPIKRRGRPRKVKELVKES